MRIRQYVVDAFASRPFTGNPAAVCLLPHWLEDDVLQAIARENNLSETAFLVDDGEVYGLRWMTPECEVDLCGHATLAAAHALFSHEGVNRDVLRFHTRSGELRVARRADGWLELDFPAQPAAPCATPAMLVSALGLTPREVRAGMDFLVVLESERQVRALMPDMAHLASLPLRGVIVTAPGEDVDFVSRFFAPGVGIPEDPVTGSAHCALTPYWAERLGKSALKARQISRRTGELRCELQGDRVLIAGQAVTFLVGELLI